MIDVRAGILAITICLLIHHFADTPQKPLPQNAPICVQPYFNRQGHLVNQQWVPCQDLDRYEIA